MRVLLVLLLLALPALADTWCNPLDIDYRYGFEHLPAGISYRSGADPVIINHQGEYALFVTISGGWWHSKDLTHWSFVTPDRWPFEDMCAPAAISVNGKLYLFQSTFGQRPILVSDDPSQGHLDWFNRWMPPLEGSKGPWDPAFFHDPESDRWYLYWGSSNVFPLDGCELDFSRQLAYKSPPVHLISLHPDQHGWERFGQDHRENIKPFMEGAWVTKHGGRYYLQYGAPGTEYNVYSTGAYVGDDPLGPFTYLPNNPIAYRPGGYAMGAGHGNTFQDNFGNYFTTGTCWIGVNWGMERRIVMHPSGFDKDGLMFADTRFGDWPHRLPTSRWQDPAELFCGWMLLSYQKPVTATSGEGAANLTDENIRTHWLAQSNHPGEGFTVDLGRPFEVKAIQVNYADYKSDLYLNTPEVYTDFKLYTSLDNQTWQPAADTTTETRRDRANAYCEIAPRQARYVRFEHLHIGAPNLAVADLRVFGNGDGPPPAAPAWVKARRDTDRRNAFVSWAPVPGAVGYNIRWGLAPDKLYQTYQVFGASEQEIRALTIDQDYVFAVEAFDENGVSPLTR
ncbi:MAG: family 43 glycosylhydrolase [Vulcanimicrobiota bacterium]